MVTLTSKKTLGDVLKYEEAPNYSREVVILAEGKTYPLGCVLGRKGVGGDVTVGAGVADAGNTGNGTLTLAGTPHTAAVKEGVYTIVFTSATKANVENPKGESVGVATVGTAFNKEIAFTLAAGGTAFAAGDRWTVPVTIDGNDGEYDEWDPAASNGTEEVAGVLIWNIDATDGPVESVAVVRNALVSRDALEFKNGITAEQKADAFDQLNRLGVAVRITA